jgi:hypothetical protein
LQAKQNSKFKMKDLSDFCDYGVGKAIVCVANGYTFEQEIETLKKYRHNVDILACDKTLGSLIDNDIYPDFLLLCDANVSYEKYCAPWADKLKDTIIFSNVCANPEWVNKAVWKDIYFFVNKDILQSEKEFKELSGCNNVIAAATNVSNAQVVFLTQSDETGSRNFFGYDKIILIGFDYCWLPNKYYAFENESPKNNYMRHEYTVNNNGSFCYTSSNLLFSSRWLSKYVRSYKLPVVNCSAESILDIGPAYTLCQQMQYSYKKENGKILRDLNIKRIELEKALRNIKIQTTIRKYLPIFSIDISNP